MIDQASSIRHSKASDKNTGYPLSHVMHHWPHVESLMISVRQLCTLLLGFSLLSGCTLPSLEGRTI